MVCACGRGRVGSQSKTLVGFYQNGSPGKEILSGKMCSKGRTKFSCIFGWITIVSHAFWGITIVSHAFWGITIVSHAFWGIKIVSHAFWGITIVSHAFGGITIVSHAILEQKMNYNI